MLELRDLTLLISLSRHGHFGRAAEECGISQPAFSMRIRNLEDKLGTPIVRRGNRFKGLTIEGDAIVEQARGILEDVRRLEQQVRSSSGDVQGKLILACVPTAAAYTARLTGALYAQHPGVTVQMETASSLQIQLWIDEGRIDAGITYGDGLSDDMLEIQHLYDEHYLFICPVDMAPRNDGHATWAEAAERPLSLLEPGMLNRRILDATFAEVGVMPKVISETNALTTPMVLARDGHAATVMPASLIETLGTPAGAVALPLIDPVVVKPIALVSAGRGATLPTVVALKAVASDLHDQK